MISDPGSRILMKPITINMANNLDIIPNSSSQIPAEQLISTARSRQYSK